MSKLSEALQKRIQIACVSDAAAQRLFRFLELELELLCRNDDDEIRVLRQILHHVRNIDKNTKPPELKWNVIVRSLEPIPNESKPMDTLKLGQIPLGQRLPVDFVPDENVDVKSDSKYASVTVIEGDATAFVGTASSGEGSYDSAPNKWRCYFNGDGALGNKAATVAVDGHVGEGDVEVEQRVEWEVISKDATSFSATVQKLEPIPAP